MKISPAKTAATPASRNSVVVVIVMSVLPGLDRYPERCVHRHFLREGDGVICAGPRTESTARHDVAHIGRRSCNGRFLSADSHRGIRAAWRILVVWMGRVFGNCFGGLHLARWSEPTDRAANDDPLVIVSRRGRRNSGEDSAVYAASRINQLRKSSSAASRPTVRRTSARIRHSHGRRASRYPVL